MRLSTRLAGAMVLLVLLTVAAVGLLSYRSVEGAILTAELDRVETHAGVLSAELQSHVGNARADVTAFRAAAALDGIIRAHVAGGADPRDGRTEEQWRAGLATRFMAELAAKPAYLIMRVIGTDDGGREILRVDRSGADGAIRRVPDAELGRKDDRDFFLRSVGLPDGQTYVSQIDFNQERGAVILRTAAPVHTPDGRTFGIIVINVNMQPLFASLRAQAPVGRQVFVVNGDGDYLLHPDAGRAFGFRRGHPSRWQDDLPELAAALGPRESGVALVHDSAGERIGAAISTVRPAAGPRAGIIETVPYAMLMAPAMAVRQSSAMAAVIAMACAVGLAGLLARSLTRPLSAMTRAVESFAQHRPVAVPIDAGGEIGILARAFARMLGEVVDKTAALSMEIAEHRRTESELERHAERERLYGAVVEFSNDAIVTQTLDGIITAWNPAAEQVFGYAAQEVIGKSIEIIVPEDRRAELRDMLARIARGEPIQHFETRRITRDGHLLDISLSMSPIKSRSGEIVGAAKVARDITDRLKTRRALLQESEERRQIFDNSLDLILVTDRKGTFVSVSPSSLEILGYRPDEMVGHSAVEFILADDLENTRREMRMARKGRAMRNFECRYVHRDGRIVALTWSGVWSEPVQKHFFSGRDVTERKLAEEELRDSERMARGVIDTALDAFVQMDDAGTITDWNQQAEAVFGWLRAEAIGRTLAELIVPEPRRPDFAADLAPFLLSGERALLGRRFDLEAVRRDGKELKVELSLAALRRRGRYVFNAFIRDLTEKVAADEQLRQSQKMETVGQLTGGIAHDFNNILTVITGTIEILEDGVADDECLSAIAKMID